MREQTLRVEAPHFCAHAVFRNGRCVAAAPIIRWMMTADNGQIKRWLDHKGYTYSWHNEKGKND